MFGEPLGFFNTEHNARDFNSHSKKIPYFAEVICQKCKKQCSIKLADAKSIKARQHQSAGIKMFMKNTKGCGNDKL